MTQVTAFHFESQHVRIIVDDHGEPWFVAVDVCSALAISNPSDALKRLDDDEKMTLDTTEGHSGQRGGAQALNVVNESGLYSLILTSRKPEAKRFKRWVTHEVLPSIRKSGFYAAPGAVASLPTATHDRVSAILSIGEAISRVAGVKPGIAMAATLTAIHENTGIGIEALRKALPSANEPICSLNPTQVGERVGLSPRTVNLRLQALGFQFKNDRDEWELTEAGRAWAEALPYSRNGHSGYQILWKPEVADLLKEAA